MECWGDRIIFFRVWPNSSLKLSKTSLRKYNDGDKGLVQFSFNYAPRQLAFLDKVNWCNKNYQFLIQYKLHCNRELFVCDSLKLQTRFKILGQNQTLYGFYTFYRGLKKLNSYLPIACTPSKTQKLNPAKNNNGKMPFFTKPILWQHRWVVRPWTIFFFSNLTIFFLI